MKVIRSTCTTNQNMFKRTKTERSLGGLLREVKKFFIKGFKATREVMIGLITDNVRNIYYGRITKRQKRQK